MDVSITDDLKALEKPCRGCGKPMLMIQDKNTKAWIPLDPKAPTYCVYRIQDNEGKFVYYCERTTANVSHFATCRDANEFYGVRDDFKGKHPKPKSQNRRFR